MNDYEKIIELLQNVNAHLTIYTTVLGFACLAFSLITLVAFIGAIRKYKEKKRLALITSVNLNESISKDKDNVND